MAAVAAAGLFFTSDCLSEEKREGTLGFLFLTDLRGYDVVGGKLLATSLRCFYGLLAIMPILGVTLLMGGVTGAQFWKTALALFNALFCSLAAGMFISSISRDPQKAMAATFLFLLLWIFAGLIPDWISGMIAKRGFIAQWSLTSPLFVFTSANAWGRNPFWMALGVTQLIGWTLLALASVTLPRSWQEKRKRTGGAIGTWSYAWRYGGDGRRKRLRDKLLERGPVLWLACRERWQSVGLWILAALSASVFLLLLLLDVPQGAWMGWRFIGWIFTAAIYLWMASQAGRFFIEARRSGLIELILATPLKTRDMVAGQWRALARMFLPPIAVVALVDLAAQAFSGLSISVAMGAGLSGFPKGILFISTAVAGLIMMLANLTAISWFGMWMGMTSKNNNLATLKTILLVQVVPWMLISFSSILVLPLLLLPRLLQAGGSGANSAAMTTIMTTWYPLVTTGMALLLNLGKNIAFTAWARRKLYTSFREQAVRSLSPVKMALAAPVPVSPRVPAPPVVIGK